MDSDSFFLGIKIDRLNAEIARLSADVIEVRKSTVARCVEICNERAEINRKINDTERMIEAALCAHTIRAEMEDR